MTVSELRREEIESIIKDKIERYHEVEIEEETIVLPPKEFDEHFGYVGTGYNGGGYAWVIRKPSHASELSESTRTARDERRRSLMIYPRTEDEWGLPGGGRVDDETFEEAAIREVREETGIECEITDLWLLRKQVWESEALEDNRRAFSLQTFFDASYVGGNISIQSSELNGAAWFAIPPKRMMSANRFRAEFWSP